MCCYITILIQILASSLLQELDNEEKSILLHQLMQLRNTSLHLVNTIINTNPSDNDDIILVLGAMVRNSNATIHNIVVSELLKRLNMAVTSANNTDTLITLTYALGNSGSKLAIHSLLSSLQHDDIDVQIAAIRSLGHHLDQPIVQKAFIIFLALADEDKVLEEILMILIDAFDNMILTNPSKEFLDAIVSCTIKLKNPNLYELFAKYIQKLHRDDIEEHMSLLRQQHNHGEVVRDLISDVNGINSRVKRPATSDWDAYNSDYDVVASHSQRKSDVTTYPSHNAYIWGNSYGVDKLSLKVGAGVFIGFNCQTNVSKLFTKAVGKIEVFGRIFNLVHLEYSDQTSGNNYLYHKLYVKFGSNVIKNTYNSYYISSCQSNNRNLWNSGEYTVFHSQFNIWIFVGTVSVYNRGSVSSRGDVDLCTCPLKVYGNLKPSFSVRVSGGASASLLVS